MAITISGQNNNDRILASDGVLDSISGFNVVGVLTASTFETTGEITANHIDVGSSIQLGNAGIITATTLIGNVTGNVNSTSNLLLQISGSEKFRVGSSGQLGIGGANYGSSGQVLTSGGSGSAATWSTIASDAITEGNTNAEVIDSGSNGFFRVVTESSERLRITSNGIVNIGDGVGNEYLNSTLKIRKDQNAVTRVTIRNEHSGGGSAAAFQMGATGNSWMLQCGSAANDSNAFTIRVDGTSNSNTGTERFRLTTAGAIGLNGANYGSSGQVLTSQGSSSAPTWTTISTDLVSDTSPQLGGTLDGNGQTANFTANNTGLGIPIGTTGNQPNAASYKGYIRYNDDDDVIYYSNGSAWQKISAKIATLSNISGSIYVGTTTNLTLTGTGFLSSNLVVNFFQSSDSINANVTVAPSSDTAATVAVPASVYNNVTAGNAVSIKVTNSDGSTSTTVNVTALALPTGGSIYTSGGYRYHKFTSSGTFTQTLSRTVEYLIVAGGGAGGGSNSSGNRLGGGGGAGGLRGGSVSTTPQSYTITIGAGGSGVGAQVSERANSGSNSSAFGITSLGGGGGGSGDNGGSGSDGGNGGSGGGAGRTGSGGSGTSGQGNDGGDHNSSTNPRVQGGGGGAGAAGNNGSNNGSNGNGYGGVGSNAYSTWASATSSGDSGYYAGGGGGGWHGSYSPATRALGGAGGGGNGGDSTGDNSNAYGKTGDANTGGGGGGNSTTSPHNGVSGAPSGPAGGSGIVIIRYQL